jgi:hypothetical protein
MDKMGGPEQLGLLGRQGIPATREIRAIPGTPALLVQRAFQGLDLTVSMAKMG